MTCHPDRRDVLRALSGLAAAPWLESRRAPPPDILVVLVDDIGWPDLEPHVPMPDFDRLRAESLVLSRAFSYPLGAPTMYSLLSGRFPERDGMLRTPEYWELAEAVGPGPVAGLVPERVALPRLLRAAGYSTGLFGKWNLGAVPHERRPDAPHLCGFDAWRAGVPSLVTEGGGKGYSDWIRVDDGVERRETRYQTTEMRDAFLDWWAHAEGPRFGLVSFQAAHFPYHEPPAALLPGRFEDMQPPERPDSLPAYQIGRLMKRWPERRAYLALVQSVGRVTRQVLEAVGQDTFVLLLSDNGTPGRAAAHERRQERLKGTTYDGGVHVPAFVRGPGIRPGTASGLVSSVDVFATVLDLAGITPEHEGRDSVSFRPLLSDPDARTRSWVYAATPRERMLRTETHKLRIVNDRPLVYDLENDPLERQEMGSKRKALPRLVEELTEQLDAVL